MFSVTPCLTYSDIVRNTQVSLVASNGTFKLLHWDRRESDGWEEYYIVAVDSSSYAVGLVNESHAFGLAPEQAQALDTVFLNIVATASINTTDHNVSCHPRT